MLQKADFDSWCRSLKLSSEAVALIESIRSSQPVRAAHSSIGNVIGRFPSRKMEVTIQFESHKNELAFIREYEYEKYEKEVLEFYDQPLTIKLIYKSISGRCLGVLHTPDFFVIRREAAGWEECKTEEHLINLASKNPNRYFQDSDGSWRCPPGESYAQQFGLYYRVRSSNEINWTYQRNIEFLDDYFRADLTVLEPERSSVLAKVRAEPGITLRDLLWGLEGLANHDSVFLLIAIGELYVDLNAVPLTEPEKVVVFSDHDTAVAFAALMRTPEPDKIVTLPFLELITGNAVQWDGKGWVIANVGEKMIGLIGENGKFTEVPITAFEKLVRESRIIGINHNVNEGIHPEAKRQFQQADRFAYAEANRRMGIVLAYIHGQPLPIKIPERTLRFWVAQYHIAEETYGIGYVGLLPCRKPGNTTRKLPPSTQALIDEFIEKEYETLKQKRKYAVYASFLRACEQRGVLSASYKTFIKAIKLRSSYQRVLKRQGRKAAYKHKEFYWELTLTTPRHGERPFHIAHIDHTELDVELVCSVTGQNLGRPWLTLLMDAFSRRILAVYLTFDPPSYRSCMMVIRECVRRFGRLPQIVIVDGGLEFSSTYFETLLARYESTKKTRPPSESRFGSVCERLFGTTNTRFVHNLQGNTQLMRNVRQVTKSTNPKTHAIWTLEKLYQYLCEWVYEVYDTLEHPALSQSPRDAFAAGMLNTGERTHKLIPYNNDFRMLTFPTTPKGTAKIQPNRGVKIRNIYYWSEAFRNPTIVEKQVQVRYDPFDSSKAFAYVSGQWAECLSEHSQIFDGRSERELMIATAELRKRRAQNSSKFNITALQLAQFLESVESEELLLRQRATDKESRNILHLINGGLTPHARDLISHPTSTSEQISSTQTTNSASSNRSANTMELELYEEL